MTAGSVAPARGSSPLVIASRVASLAIFVVVPLLGILLFGWDWREIVLLYWLENVTLGLAGVVRIARSEGPGVQRGALAGFFVIHYGLFTFVHGIFVLLIVGGFFDGFFSGFAGFDDPSFPGPGGTDFVIDPTTGSVVASEPAPALDWGWTLVVAAVGGLVQVAVAAFGPAPAAPPQRVMMSAYPRIFVLHFSIIVGVLLIVLLGLPAAAAILLVVLHGAIDVLGWRGIGPGAASEGTGRHVAATGPGDVPSAAAGDDAPDSGPEPGAGPRLLI